MKQYYQNEFEENVRNMIFFFIFEIIFIGVFIMGHFGSFFMDITHGVIITGAYPIQQALCLIYLKRTRDPLDGISKLDFIYIVSITQNQK